MQENMTSALAFILLFLNISLLNGKGLSSHSPCLDCLGVARGGGVKRLSRSVCSAVMRNENVRVICCYKIVCHISVLKLMQNLISVHPLSHSPF